MSRPQLLSRLVIGLFIAANALTRGIAGSAEPSAPPEPRPEAQQPLPEQRDAGVDSEPAKDSEKAGGQTKEGDRQETAQRDELLILLLQILRSSK